MKLSSQTLEILKNFASINQSIYFLEGQCQKTFSPLKVSYAEAVVAESFPRDFAIYDLNTLLGVFSLFTAPDLEFTDTAVVLSEGRQKATYRYCNPELIVHPPRDKRPNVGEVVAKFQLPAPELKSILKAVALFGHEHIGFNSDSDGNLTINTVKLNESQSSEGVSIRLAEGSVPDIQCAVAVANLRLLPHSFTVSVTKRAVMFASNDAELTYIVPVETTN